MLTRASIFVLVWNWSRSILFKMLALLYPSAFAAPSLAAALLVAPVKSTVKGFWQVGHCGADPPPIPSAAETYSCTQTRQNVWLHPVLCTNPPKTAKKSHMHASQIIPTEYLLPSILISQGMAFDVSLFKAWDLTLKGPGVSSSGYVTICTNPQDILNWYFIWSIVLNPHWAQPNINRKDW